MNHLTWRGRSQSCILITFLIRQNETLASICHVADSESCWNWQEGSGQNLHANSRILFSNSFAGDGVQLQKAEGPTAQPWRVIPVRPGWKHQRWSYWSLLRVPWTKEHLKKRRRKGARKELFGLRRVVGHKLQSFLPLITPYWSKQGAPVCAHAGM